MEDNSAYMARNVEVPRYATAYSANYFYVYENFTPGDFGVLKKIKIVGNEAYIDSIRTKIGENNGKSNITSTNELNRVLEVLKTQTRRNRSNNALDSEGRANSDNGGVSLGESASDGIGYSQKGNRDTSSLNTTVDNEVVEELTEDELKYIRLYKSELGAHLSANLLGTESFIDKLVRENTTIAEKVLNKISDLKQMFERLGDAEARAEYKKIKKAEKLYLDAVEKAGYAYVGRKIIGAIEEREEEPKFSYAGKKAKTADKLKLATAEQMLKDGIDSETVRKETGWFKGYDGKWRFEIDDSQMVFSKNGFNPDLLEYKDLELKFITGTITAEEQTRLRELSNTVKGINLHRLDQFAKHDALFEAYPELRGIELKFTELDGNEKGNYDYRHNELQISNKLSQNEIKETLIHEIQHAVQHLEEFTVGSNLGMFNNTEERSAYEQYENTAGEIEARDVSKRLDYDADKRKNTRPDIDRSDVVFANDTGIAMSAISSYPYSMQTVIKEYINSGDSHIEEMVTNLQKNGDIKFERHEISDVSERNAKDLKMLTGVDYTGYTHYINTNAIRHIEIRHGVKGKADTSMANPKDVSRIPYVLEKYDSVDFLRNENGDIVYSEEFRDKNDKPVPLFLYKKRINGTYYYVEAVGENSYKKLWTTSAYISKEELTYVSASDKVSRQLTSKTLHTSHSSNSSIPENSEKGKDFDKKTQNNSKNNDVIVKSKGEYQKLKADYTKKKKYDKKEVSTAILDIPYISTLPKATQNDIIESMWYSLNTIESDNQKDRFINMCYNRILRDLWQESNSFAELPADEIREIELKLPKVDLFKGSIEKTKNVIPR